MRSYKTWNEAHAEAVRMAHLTGLDAGIERAREYGREVWNVRYLPKPENRYGADARCEVVRAKDWPEGAAPEVAPR